ncbi:PH domain-like protein [Xylona heveae TC161]|uniref:PH domain-like protein n=1 Tax=Xylona heveae (strain CBS 132557 / TC161) TaxID=1328760 RepID=A0A165JUE2_XYLHT|nr:PH domain-like protein [Xylona heveae TC161]KZF26642.1 PH domain-like protein [Xylona heveae TC161]
MAQTLSSPSHSYTGSQPRSIPPRIDSKATSLPSIPIPSSSGPARSGHLNLDTFSPVNQNGSFEFDKVLKTGEVNKRTRKTKSWKRCHLVLRPNLLNIYKDAEETRLHHQINLSEVTAVANLLDPKGRRDYLFGIFTPSRNYHFQGSNKEDARHWVDLLRQEARIDEEEREYMLASPTAKFGSHNGIEKAMAGRRPQRQTERFMSSSPEPSDHYLSNRSPKEKGDPRSEQTRPSQSMDFSMNELGSCSDFSDVPGQTGFGGSSSSLPHSEVRDALEENKTPSAAAQAPAEKSGKARKTSGLAAMDINPEDERVIWHGWLSCLKSTHGMRQWKRLWVVLRSKNVAFYKDEQEYSARLILPLDSILNVVEIDPISKKKEFCMQIIAESKTYRLAAPTEEALEKCLGAFKSLLSKRNKDGLTQPRSGNVS